MGVQVDFEKRIIVASVRNLAETPGDGSQAMGLPARFRAEMGMQVHRRYRSRRGKAPGFAAEVGVELRREVDEFTALLSGRIDGIIDDGKALTVEEVKSVALTEEQLGRSSAGDFPGFCLQARLYALCLACRWTDREIRVRLVLASILDGSERTLEVSFDEAKTDRQLDRLLRQALDEAVQARRRARQQAECARRLRFPYPEMRPWQKELIEVMGEGLEAGRPVLATAPTGIGKTVAALLSGLRHSLSQGATLFFLTAKTTQQDLAARTFLDVVGSSGPQDGSPMALTLRAKERMCPPGHLLCHSDLCPLLRDFAQRAQSLRAVEGLMEGAAHVAPDRVYQRGEALKLCPFELSMEIASQADLVICDYNYIYGQAAARLFPDEGGSLRAVAVIDEAHNLFDRVRQQLSPFLSRSMLDELRRRLGQGGFLAPSERKEREEAQMTFESLQPAVQGPALFSDLDDLLGTIRAFIDTTLERAESEERAFLEGCTPLERDAESWEGFAQQAARLMVRYAIYNRLHQIIHPRDPLMAALSGVLQMRDALAEEEPEFIPYAARPDSPGGAGLGVLCVNPARRLESRHRQLLGTVAMSATLSPLPYYSDVLGFAPLDPVTLSAPSPFPEENRRVLIIPTVDTTYRRRDRHLDDIARLIAQIAGVCEGRYVAYFSSFAFLSKVRPFIPLPSDQVLVQLPSMTDPMRRRMLDNLRLGVPPKLLLAVMGGIFAEGIDLPGEELLGAIVVGPGLPKAGFERELMGQYYQESNGDGFAYAMIYPGMRRVIQSAGRVIRSMDDRGVIVLVGGRFAQHRYAECLPPHWYRYSPQELVVRDPVGELKDFWEERG